MSYSSSQEQTIYRSLAGQIQLGFFDHGERFPSAQEIARRYDVSYCPAQRALKALEKDGLVRLCRGKETIVLAKPYENYLESPVFKERVTALADLCKTLDLISSDICFQGLCHMKTDTLLRGLSNEQDPAFQGKLLYRLFERSLRMLGSQTALSLYYDVGSFIESAFLDILYALHGEKEAARALHGMTASMLQSLRDCQSENYTAARLQLSRLGTMLYAELESYLAQAVTDPPLPQVPFQWAPHKGRLQYCDVIAIDLLCKINQGMYPVGILLPKGAFLADVYHVSEITIRRTIILLNKLEVVKTINGVGTRVVSIADSTILRKLKKLMMEDNLKSFLEAYQLLAVTCKSVIQCTFPHISEKSFAAMAQALDADASHASLVAAISACLQAVVRCCPLAAVREIYEKLTLLLLAGGLLRLDQAAENPIPAWSELSTVLRQSLEKKDGARFATAFQKLFLGNFLVMKETLVKAGISGADGIVTPIIPAD